MLVESLPALQNNTLFPITREIDADLETPVSVYLKLTGEGPSFLLESVSGGEQVARYSFIGIQPRAAFVIDANTVTKYSGPELTLSETSVSEKPLQELKKALAAYPRETSPGLPRLVGGLVGFLSYDCVRFFEPTLELPLHDLPDGIFLLSDVIVAFDHTRGQVLAIAHAHGDTIEARGAAEERLDSIQSALEGPLPVFPATSIEPKQVERSHTQSEFEALVSRAKEYIVAGDVFQVVLSQKFTRHTNAQPFDVYRALRRLNPSPYMFFFDFGNLHTEPFYLLGASPEMHVRLEGTRATLRPIAGTRPRGQTAAEDAAHEADLLADPKERAEHVMLVDLGRNDLGRVCEYGTVELTEMMTVEHYSHVMHIVSQVEGELRPEYDSFDLMAATFPAGTVSGAPKVRAMEIIAELEAKPRGPYAGVVGYFGFDGSMDTCIALRTMYMQSNRITVQAGGGVVFDSNPTNEHDETMNKAAAVLKAIDLAEANHDRNHR